MALNETTISPPPPGSTVSYPDLREAGRALIPKLYRTAVSREFDMLKAAKKLTVPVHERTLLFFRVVSAHGSR